MMVEVQVDVSSSVLTARDYWKIDRDIENIVKIPPFLENPWGFSFKNTPFLLESMDHASNQKEPSFSMQMRTSVCSTFVLDCRGRGNVLGQARSRTITTSK